MLQCLVEAKTIQTWERVSRSASLAVSVFWL